LSGSDLFLLSAVSTSPDFDENAQVPDGFTGTTLDVPRPSPASAAESLYLKLRDDPTTVQNVNLPVLRGAATATANPSSTDSKVR
jgi:hypothetical protein